jgi:hypothetical protein
LKQEDLILIMGSEQKASKLLDDLQVPPDGVISPQVLRNWWINQKKHLEFEKELSIRFDLTSLRLTVTDDSAIEVKGATAQRDLLSFLLDSAVFQFEKRSFDSSIKFDVDQLSIESFSALGERYVVVLAKSSYQSSSFFCVKLDIMDPLSPSFTLDTFPTVCLVCHIFFTTACLGD